MGTLPLYKRCLQRVPQRYIAAIMNFSALLSVSTMSSCLSLTITQMVIPNKINETLAMELNSDVDWAQTSCPMSNEDTHINGTLKSTMLGERYDWSEELQGVILGSFYIGYVLMHLPGALLAERIGGKWVLVFGLGITSIFTILTPAAIHLGDAYALIFVRIIVGTCQGGMWPAVSTIMASWVPKCERGFLGSIVFCGFPCGAIVGNFVAGLLLDYFRNWHVVFYGFGAMGTIVTLFYMFLCTSNPSTHPFITEKEKAYLQKEMGQLERDKNMPPTPWRAILTSKPVIALMIDMCLGDWAYFVVMIDLPKYMNDVLHVSVRENGVYSSFPWAMRILVSFLSGYWCDWLIRSGRLSITNTRKLFVIFAAAIDGSFVLAASYAGCDAMLVGLFFVVSVGAQGFLASSTLMNPMDLSPNFAGTITGLTNGIGSITGIMVPYVIGVMTPNSLQTEWRAVFWMTFCIQMAKIVNFTFMGSGKVQPWNQPERSSSHELNEKGTIRKIAPAQERCDSKEKQQQQQQAQEKY